MEEWDKQLASCKDNIDRALLARSNECHQVLLRAFCYDDMDPIVVEEAALNPNSKEHWVAKALERFPTLNTPEFWKYKHHRQLEEIAKIEDSMDKYSGDRDQVILKHILENDKPQHDTSDHASQHLGKIPNVNDVVFSNPDIPWKKTSKYRVAMVMAPAWGVIFPPYNLAKLVGLLRHYDYSTKVYDLNIECYRLMNGIVEQDYWRSEKFFLWIHKDNFNKFILPYIKPILQKAIQNIVASKPKVVGFSIYNTNVFATGYMVREIRRLLPDVCIVGGGPEVSVSDLRASIKMLPFNYLFVGEAESTFIDFLENIPKQYESSKYIGDNDSKLKLEDFPYADYTDYNLENYKYGQGVSIETSRGCIAQCSFCAETYFWKFRSLEPERVIAEMKHQIELHNIKRFWFVDSLANGNLKNFERLIDLIIENNLDIHWNSYVRCDGRMTKKLLDKVKDSGCTSLSYGIESGSQKVLHDMRKKIEVWEIEQNIRDSKDIHVHANWIIGFPTEEPIDALHSLQMIGNIRTYVDAISPGFGAGPAAASHLQTDWHVYGIVGKEFVFDTTFLQSWYTENYRNTMLNRFIRIKFFHVWLEILSSLGNSTIDNSQRYPNIESFYKFKSPNKCKDYVTYDEYVNLDRLNPDEFSHNVTNEYFVMAYILYLYFGAYDFEFTFDHEIDKNTFGNSLASNYDSKFKISMSDTGDYTLSIEQTFKHRSDDPNTDLILKQERERKDQSFIFNYHDSGNINDWVMAEKQTKETVHAQYRNKKKIIPIVSNG